MGLHSASSLSQSRPQLRPQFHSWHTTATIIDFKPSAEGKTYLTNLMMHSLRTTNSRQLKPSWTASRVLLSSFCPTSTPVYASSSSQGHKDLSKDLQQGSKPNNLFPAIRQSRYCFKWSCQRHQRLH